MSKWFVLPLFLVGTSVSAQQLTTVYADTLRGDFVLFGNTLGFDGASGVPTPTVGTVGSTGTNTTDDAPDVFWRSDEPASGQASADVSIIPGDARSTAVLTLPAGASVRKAYLFWAATTSAAVSGATAQTAVIERPGSFSNTVTSEAVYVSSSPAFCYQARADVTALVTAQGAGAYRVGGIAVQDFRNAANSTAFAGWSMVVVYARAADPGRRVDIKDGLVPATSGFTGTTFSGNDVPNAGFTGKLGVVAYEGDNTVTGDRLLLAAGTSTPTATANSLTDAQNPAANFFNGTRSYLGAAVTTAGDLPQLTGTAQSMGGMDIDVVDITSKLQAGLTSYTTALTTTGGDAFYAGVMVGSASISFAALTLPLTLTHFSAQAQGEKNVLHWQTAEELPKTTFAVERSADGEGFSAIGRMAGTDAGSTYSLDDDQPLAPVTYYRLRTEDASGGAAVSQILAVRRNGVQGSQVTVWPSPANDRVVISVSGQTYTGQPAAVVDMTGKTMQTLTLQPSQQVDVQAWPAGVYLLRLADGTALRLVKQ